MRWFIAGLAVLSLIAAAPSEAKKRRKNKDAEPAAACQPACRPICQPVRICQPVCQPVAIRWCQPTTVRYCAPSYVSVRTQAVSQNEAVKGSIQQTEAPAAQPVQQK